MVAEAQEDDQSTAQQEAYPERDMNTLYLAWRQLDLRWWPIGQLTRQGREYVFSYTKGALSAEKAGFHPLLTFPDRDKVYVSKELFPLFANRLPPKSRPDYDDFVGWLDLGAREADPMVLLARSGGRRETDMFEVFPVPERDTDGRYRSTFFVHGIRHRPVESQEEAARLQPGVRLELSPEPTNAADPLALRVLSTGTHLGFVPRYLCQDVHDLRAAGGHPGISAVVQRVNLSPTPMQFRVLCRVEAPWPAGFRPLASPDFEPLHSLATAP